MVASSAPVTAAVTQPTSASTFANMLGGLLVVIAIIFLLVYLIKRFNLVPSSSGVIKTLAVTPLGQKERVVLVELDGQQYLLGVTAQQISMIDKLSTPVTIPDRGFATKLQQMQGERADAAIATVKPFSKKKPEQL